MKTVFKYILMLIPILYLSCSEEEANLVLPPEGKGEIKLEVFPKTVVVGDKILITASDSVGFVLTASYPEIIFPDSTWVYPDSIRDDTIYATVPYTYESGSIMVNTPTDQFTTDSLIIVNNCLMAACVINWDLNYDITKEDSYDHFTQTGWLYQISGDTICISLEADGPNHTIRKYLYFRQDSLSVLPEFIGGSYFIFTTSIWQFEIDSAIVKIFHWDDNGAFAGKLFSTPWWYFPVSDVFWADSLKN